MKTHSCFFLILFGTLYAQQDLVNLPYCSQLGQDKYILENFFTHQDGTYKNDGFFIEFGAYDGRIFSNTYVLEVLGWKGICIEPVPKFFKQLEQNRSCICIEGCISDKEGKALFRQVCDHEVFSGLVEKFAPEKVVDLNSCYPKNDYYNVNCYTLSSLLNNYEIKKVDFLSIDTEGGELDILKSLSDTELALIDVICVEDNYNNPAFIEFLESKNFKCITRLGHDIIFRNKKYLTPC